MINSLPRTLRAQAAWCAERRHCRGALFLAAFVVAWMLVASAASAQDNGDVAALGRRVTTFLQNLETKPRSTEATFAEFLANGRLGTRRQDIQSLVASHAKLVELYGAAKAFEQVEAHSIGKDVYSLTYLAKTETYPIVWYVTFYRTQPSDEKLAAWVVISLRFDTRIENIPPK
jgi:hypothetical protein